MVCVAQLACVRRSAKLLCSVGKMERPAADTSDGPVLWTDGADRALADDVASAEDGMAAGGGPPATYDTAADLGSDEPEDLGSDEPDLQENSAPAEVLDSPDEAACLQKTSRPRPPHSDRPHHGGVSLLMVFFCNAARVQVRLDAALQAAFAFLQTDMDKNMQLAFCSGLLGGGAGGKALGAFAYAFGSALAFSDAVLLHAVISLVAFVEASCISGSYDVLSCAHMGEMVHRALYTQRICPYTAAGLTLAAAGILHTSAAIALVTVVIHVWSAFQAESLKLKRS